MITWIHNYALKILRLGALLIWLPVGYFVHYILHLTGRVATPKVHLIDLRSKVVVVTGSNTGIGLRTATAFIKCGANVIFACRSEAKARKAMKLACDEGLAAENNFAQFATVHFMELDLSITRSVHSFVESFARKFDSLDVIVLNAGLNTAGTTPDKLDQRWQANYLGHWLLASKLLPLMSKSRGPRGDGCRVVCLSSVMHHFGSTENFEVHCCGEGRRTFASRLCKQDGARAAANVYKDSKLAMNLLAIELQRRFDSLGKPAGITLDGIVYEKVNDESDGRELADEDESTAFFVGRESSLELAPQRRLHRPRAVTVSPGAVASDIWRGVPPLLRSLVFDPLMTLVFLNTDEGSHTSFHAATTELPGHESGYGDLPPYYSPYWVPTWQSWSFSFPFEALGPFIGARLSPQTLPRDVRAAALELWELSERTANRLEGQ